MGSLLWVQSPRTVLTSVQRMGKPDDWTVLHILNPRAWEAKAGRSESVGQEPRPHSESISTKKRTILVAAEPWAPSSGLQPEKPAEQGRPWHSCQDQSKTNVHICTNQWQAQAHLPQPQREHRVAACEVPYPKPSAQPAPDVHTGLALPSATEVASREWGWTHFLGTSFSCKHPSIVGPMVMQSPPQIRHILRM